MPTTHYAKSGDLNIAYQSFGDGPRDLVYVPGWVSHVELMWEDPVMSSILDRLASFSRVITFDKRGTGMSDPVPLDRLPALEERMDDVRAVMDAVKSERAILFGHSEGGNLATLFAATYPKRTEGLILASTYARRVRSADYPWAPTPADRNREIEEVEKTWGTPGSLPEDMLGTRSSDPTFVSWFERYLRLSASPRAASHLLRMNTQMDTRSALPLVQAPALCIYRTDDTDVQLEEGRWIASQIPDARFVELPGSAHIFYTTDPTPFVDEIERFVTGKISKPAIDRMLATVLFTDIVRSSEMMSAIGDEAWRLLLEKHHKTVRSELERWRGHEEDTAGDGFFATFDGPARAVNAAHAIVDGVKRLGMQVRAGLHTGEVEKIDGKTAGTAVHIGARVSSLAEPGEVLVSRTVRDLVAGSGLKFADRGVHTLKGIPDRWQVYASVGRQQEHSLQSQRTTPRP